jgi:hypothetical protein
VTINKIAAILQKVVICDKCGKDYNFYERMWPLNFHTCKLCKRELCYKCWGQQHLFAYHICHECRPDLDCDQIEMEFEHDKKISNRN